MLGDLRSVATSKIVYASRVVCSGTGVMSTAFIVFNMSRADLCCKEYPRTEIDL